MKDKFLLENRMLENYQCWTQEVGCPEMAVVRVEVDRIITRPTQEFCVWAATHMDRWGWGTKAHQPFGVQTAWDGKRERRARWAAQIVYHHVPKPEDPALIESFLELDFDASNPNWGLALAISHFIFDWCTQKLRKARTDPFKVAKARGWLV